MMIRTVLVLACLHNILGAVLERYHTTGSSSKLLDRYFCGKEQQKLLFEVQTCMDAYIAVKTSVSKEAVLVHLGGGNNTWSSVITQSKIDGKRPSKKKYQIGILDCGHYRAFWLDWSVPGLATVGTGVRAGRNEILRAVHKIEAQLLHVSVFTLNNNKGDWKIINDGPAIFAMPAARVADVDVPEDASVGELIYVVEVKDEYVNVTLDVIGPSKKTFRMQGLHLTLSKKLDYETRRYHHVNIRAHVGHLEANAVILVHVTNVLDELPVITLSSAQFISEELPLGEVIPRPYTVTTEAGSGLIYGLTGNHTRYLDINAFNGDLITVDRLDYDDQSCPRIIDLTLEVGNSDLRKVQVNLSLHVININDNAPRFDEAAYNVQINENDYEGKPLTVIRCDDIDLEDVDNITVRIREPALADIFTINKTDSTFELQLRPEIRPQGLEEKTTLTLEARDSHTVMAKTATAIVEIEIVGFTPVWAWSAVIYTNSSTVDDNHHLEAQGHPENNQTHDFIKGHQLQENLDNNQTKDRLDNNQTKDLVTEDHHVQDNLDNNQTTDLVTEDHHVQDNLDNHQTKDRLDIHQTKGHIEDHQTKGHIEDHQTKGHIEDHQTEGHIEDHLAKGRLLEVHVLEDHPPHATIVTVNATRANGRPSDLIQYSIQSIVSDTNITSMDRFTIDESLGEIKAMLPLDADRPTGGVEYYVISVRASNREFPVNYVTCRIKLYIDDVDDNPPRFSEGFYNVLSGCPNIHEEVVLLTFNVADNDATSNVTFTIISNVSRYVGLNDDNTSLVLRSSLRASPERWDTYEVVKITAHDAGHPQPSSVTYVAVHYEDCSPRARRRRLRQKGIVPPPKSPPACETKKYVMDRTVEDYIFKATSGVLGLILVCIAAFYLSKRTVFKTSSPSVKPMGGNSENPARDRRDQSQRRRGDHTI